LQSIHEFGNFLAEDGTKEAPWYVIPANRKWVRNYLVDELVVRALDNMRLKYPAPTVDIAQVVQE
jgi:polyphosphate kinase 2 (PPK2 family)